MTLPVLTGLLGALFVGGGDATARDRPLWRVRRNLRLLREVVRSTEFGASLASAVKGDVRVVACCAGVDPFCVQVGGEARIVGVPEISKTPVAAQVSCADEGRKRFLDSSLNLVRSGRRPDREHCARQDFKAIARLRHIRSLIPLIATTSRHDGQRGAQNERAAEQAIDLTTPAATRLDTSSSGNRGVRHLGWTIGTQYTRLERNRVGATGRRVSTINQAVMAASPATVRVGNEQAIGAAKGTNI